MKSSVRCLFGLAVSALVLTIASPAMSASPPTTGLVAHYPFNGNASDASGNGLNGTASGTTVPTTDRFGNANGALSFNGSFYVDLSVLASTLRTEGQGTISLWFKHDTYSQWPIPFDPLLSFGGTGPQDSRAWLLIGKAELEPNLGQSLSFYFPSESLGWSVWGLSLAGGSGLYFDNRWHHVVMTMGSDFNAIYVDGVQLVVTYNRGSSTTGNTAWAGMTQFRIGHEYASPAKYFTGSMDDVRIYKRGLSAGEVQALFAESPAPTSNQQADCLFTWAERTYPTLFAPAATSGTYAPYYYRYYTATANYLATSSADNHIWVLGPSFGNRLLDVGPVTNFLAAAGCTQ